MNARRVILLRGGPRPDTYIDAQNMPPLPPGNIDVLLPDDSEPPIVGLYGEPKMLQLSYVYESTRGFVWGEVYVYQHESLAGEPTAN